MARKKSSAFEDVVVIVSYFPWWVGVILAVAAYFLLQPYVHMELLQTKGPGSAGTVAASSLTKMFASLGQYVLPILFLLGGAISFFKRKKREHLFEGSAQARDTNALNDPSWQEFEMLVGEAFRRKGYSVRETGGGGADGGVDLTISKDDKTYLVQCKQWKTRQVGVKPVRELAGLVATHGAAGGVVVTSGAYTDEAKSFAKQAGIVLIVGDQLHSMIKEARSPAGARVSQASEKSAPVFVAAGATDCPQCGSPMVQRVARKGANAGQAFLGCSRFPECRGTRPVA